MRTNERRATEYLDQLTKLLFNISVTGRDDVEISIDEGTERILGRLIEARETGSKVMAIGNGGSAAIASHLHNDICKAVGLRCLVFNESPFLTALANDDGYETVFESPMEQWAEEDDILFAISSSGRSENILRATKAAIRRGCWVVTFTGFKPNNPLRKMGNLNFYVPMESYGFVEVAHAALNHLITDLAMASAELEDMQAVQLV